VNKDQVLDEFKKSLKTIEDYTALMPEEMKAQIDGGVRLYNERREELIRSITDNSEEGTWEDGELEGMDTKTLEKIGKTVHPADYSAQGVPKKQSKGIQPMIPVQYQTENKN
jgi:hypothetical protein